MSNNALAYVHPIARDQFVQLAAYLERCFADGRTATEFRAFEGFRTPQRQNELLARGTTRARAWQSSHQYGLAVDFVDWDHGWKWREEADWDFLAEAAKVYGLSVPYAPWDRPHVEHPHFRAVLWPLVKV